MGLKIRPKQECRWDLVSLGEVMLRFDPGHGRTATTRHFDVYEGGGEYNVARGLKRCFGLDTAIVTALADDPVGRLIQDFIYQGGVDQSLIRWVEHDGVGRAVRNGLNFTERGTEFALPSDLTIVGTLRFPSSNPATLIGTKSSERMVRAGFTRAEFSAHFRLRPRKSLSKP